jgi:Transposase DDE domain
MRKAAVEPKLLLIVGQSVTEATNDKKQLIPMVELIEQQSGQRPEAVLADNGYCSEQNLEHLESADEPERRIEGFIATGKQKHGEHRLPAKRGPLPKGATRVDRMKRKLKTKVGKAVYAARKCVVEPVFGQINRRADFANSCYAEKRKCKASGRCCASRITFYGFTQPCSTDQGHRQMIFAQSRSSKSPGSNIDRRDVKDHRSTKISCYSNMRIATASHRITRTGS